MKKMSVSPVRIRTFTVGKMEENCYLVTDTSTDKTIIIDPGDEGNYIAEQAEQLHCIPTGIIATHGHFDHIMGVSELQMIYHIPFYIHEADAFLVKRMKETAEYFLEHVVIEAPPKVDHLMTNGDKIQFGQSFVSVLSTSGHTPGSVCLSLSSSNSVFVGDTIFAQGAIGRTDFSYSSKAEIDHSIHRILRFPSATVLYPGHGETTTVKDEKVYHRIVI
ncbi:MAG TPA: MBL fold metallo-hydrolase [Patescibacteria group bacterium]|nr:MBL fold metallo-hydrolase [Patescibacteria group bacterium]